MLELHVIFSWVNAYNIIAALHFGRFGFLTLSSWAVLSVLRLW